MAIGFTPKYKEELHLEGLTRQQFHALAHIAIQELKWSISYMSESGYIAFIDTSMFSWGAEIRIDIKDHTAHIQSASTGSEMMDFGKNKKKVQLFISTLTQIRDSVSADQLDHLYEDLKNDIPEEDALLLPPPSKTEQLNDFLSIFKPSEGYVITPILVNLNILIFIAMVINGAHIVEPGTDILLKWGANFKPITLEGEWWRLLTACFLHIGIFHLIMNMYALVYIGLLLEPILGRARFLSAYLLTGIAASLASLWWHDLTVSAGASGAIFGMYGVFLALLCTSFIEKTARKSLLISIGIFVAFNLLNGMKEGVDNAAHIGGLVSGIVIGFASFLSLRNPASPELKYGTMTLLAIIVLAGSAFAYRSMPNPIGEFDKKMERFSARELKSFEYYDLPPETPDEQRLVILKQDGIDLWQANMEMMDSISKLDLPTDIRLRNVKLRTYCELRKESYELMYKGLAEKTDAYYAQEEACIKKIDTLLKELNNK